MDISKRYSIELNKISNHLADLERGHIYELTRTPGTPSCATLAKHLIWTLQLCLISSKMTSQV